MKVKFALSGFELLCSRQGFHEFAVLFSQALEYVRCGLEDPLLVFCIEFFGIDLQSPPAFCVFLVVLEFPIELLRDWRRFCCQLHCDIAFSVCSECDENDEFIDSIDDEKCGVLEFQLIFWGFLVEYSIESDVADCVDGVVDGILVLRHAFRDVFECVSSMGRRDGPLRGIDFDIGDFLGVL